MGRRIRVKSVRKEKPEVRLYVLALIALARQLQAEEDRAAQSPPETKDEKGGEA